jgi:hypothetical protein
MYRYFHDFPLVFHTSLSFRWANGQKGEGTPPTIKTAANIVYYTELGPGTNPPAPKLVLSPAVANPSDGKH